MTLLARHGAADVVAFGRAGDRTAADLLADVARIAALLTARDGDQGTHVAVICNDRYAFAAGVLGVWRAGFAVALPPNGRPDTVASIAAREDVRWLLHDTDASMGTDFRSVLVGVEADRNGGEYALAPYPDPSAMPILATVFTSGSTGEFQPCPKTGGQLLGEVDTLIRAFALRPGQRVMATVPPHHIYGLLFTVLVPLASGGAFIREAPLHAESVAVAIERHAATVLVTVPAHLRSFELLEAGRLGHLERIVSSTAPLHGRTVAMIRERHGLGITEVLGSSETGGIAWRDRRQSQLWTPLPDVKVTVDEDGRLLVDSPFIDPELPRPHRTQDKIRLFGDGGFAHEGRADGVVKVGGRRVALAQLEHRLLALEGVTDCALAAVDVEGGRNQEIICALVAPGWTTKTLLRALYRWFEAPMVPRRFRFVEALPREANGKITRSRLLALFDRVDDTEARTVAIEQLAHRETEDRGRAAHVYDLRVPAELYYFRGHFAEFQLLPGVAQLQLLILPRIRAHRRDLARLKRLTRIKFRQPIRPGDTIQLTLTWRPAAPEVDFQLARDGRECARGRLHFETASADHAEIAGRARRLEA